LSHFFDIAKTRETITISDKEHVIFLFKGRFIHSFFLCNQNLVPSEHLFVSGSLISDPIKRNVILISKGQLWHFHAFFTDIIESSTLHFFFFRKHSQKCHSLEATIVLITSVSKRNHQFEVVSGTVVLCFASKYISMFDRSQLVLPTLAYLSCTSHLQSPF
jgi:hypothetical protein